MTDGYMSLRGFLCALVVVFVPAVLVCAQETDMGPFRLKSSVELDRAYTTIFTWDSNAFGVLAPMSRSLVVITSDGKKSTKKLDAKFEGKTGNVFPDVMRRDHNGQLYWLSRSGHFGIFDAHGRLERSFRPSVPIPFWFDIASNGDIAIFGTSKEPAAAFLEVYGTDGNRKAARESWLEAPEKAAAVARVLFFLSPAVEVSVFFPYARTPVSDATLLTQCSGYDRGFAAEIQERVRQHGMPAPLGRGVYRHTRPTPFAFWAARADNGVIWILGNGGVLTRLDGNGAVQCWGVPPPPGPPRDFVSTTVAVNEDHVGILTHYQDKTLLRIWDLGQPKR